MIRKLSLSLGFTLLAYFSFGQNARGVSAEIATPQAVGNTWAIIVGVSEYQSQQIASLRFADDDANAIATYLKSKSGGQVEQQHIEELYNKDATSSNILRAFRLFDQRVQDSPAEIKANDRIVIYLSGHGGAFTVDDSYFFPYNSNNAQDASVAISIRTIKNYIENWRLKGVQVVFIFDACRSSTIGMGADGIKVVSQYLEAKRNGEILLVASSKGQEALEFEDLQHGLFTFYLLQGLYGLADEDNDNIIKGFELASFLEKKIASHSRNKQFPFIDFNDFKSTTFSIVDPDEKSKLLQNANQIAPADFAAIAGRGSGQSSETTSGDKNSNESKFQSAIKEGRILNPENNNAVFFFDLLKKSNPGAATISKYKIDLTSALLDKAQQTLVSDLNGDRIYRRPGPGITLYENYNLRHYRDAVEALDLYIKLMGKVDDEIGVCLKAYLEARALTIERVLLPKNAQMANIKQVFQLLNSALNTCHSKAYIYFALSTTLLEEGKFKEADAVATKAIQLAPKWNYPYYVKGWVLKNNRGDSASYYLNKSAELNRNDSYPLSGLAFMQEESGNYQKAVSFYMKAYRVDTLQVDPLISLAMAYSYLGNESQARYFLKKAAVLDTKYSRIHYTAGDFFLNKMLYDSAILAYKRALSINPNHGYPHRAISRVLLLQGRTEEAIDHASRALKADEQDPWNHYQMGRCYQAQNLNDLARDNYNDALKIDNRLGEVHYFNAYSYFTEQNYELAAKTCVTALQNVPNDPYITGLAAESFLNANDRLSAVKYINEAVRLQDKNPYFHYLAARLSAMENDRSKLFVALDKALSLKLQTNLLQSPDFDRFRNDSEFKSLLKKYNLR